MNTGTLNTFLTNYVLSLFERTRVEKRNEKFGFDAIIYNLSISKDWIPIRLPFFRQIDSIGGKIKTEAEFGIDMAFLTPMKDALIIFVLKDEALNNKNWTTHNFDSDLRMAAAPDLTLKELSDIKSVKIILTYNKDEDQVGIKLFENLVLSLGTKIGDNISLSFERWNLTRIVEEIKDHLLSPQLLPQHLSGLLSYICSQVTDFDYGTTEWENQLIPNWKNFLRTALKDPIDERKIRLIPIALLILHHYRKRSQNSYPGWLDLIEWAMLPLWASYEKLDEEKLKKIVIEIWLYFYVNALEQYFLEIESSLTTEHGFHTSRKAASFVPIIDACIMYWHIGRLGILTLAPQEFADTTQEKSNIIIADMVNRAADWIVRCLRINPSIVRPLIDLNHIELFFIWLILWQSGRHGEIYKWLSELESRLAVRRFGTSNLPFIEARNRMDLVAEYVALSEKPPDFTDNSSYLLLMILELCFSLEDEYRDRLLDRFYKRLIKGTGNNNKPLSDNVSEIDLIGWAPPENWGQKILSEKVEDGVAITTGNFLRYATADKPLSEKIKEFVELSREKFQFKMPNDIPRAVFILACIKHKSPLPPEFWRGTIFPRKEEMNAL